MCNNYEEVSFEFPFCKAPQYPIFWVGLHPIFRHNAMMRGKIFGLTNVQIHSCIQTLVGTKKNATGKTMKDNLRAWWTTFCYFCHCSNYIIFKS